MHLHVVLFDKSLIDEQSSVSDGGGYTAHDWARSVQVSEQDGTAPWGKGDVS